MSSESSSRPAPVAGGGGGSGVGPALCGCGLGSLGSAAALGGGGAGGGSPGRRAPWITRGDSSTALGIVRGRAGASVGLSSGADGSGDDPLGGGTPRSGSFVPGGEDIARRTSLPAFAISWSHETARAVRRDRGRAVAGRGRGRCAGGVAGSAP